MGLVGAPGPQSILQLALTTFLAMGDGTATCLKTPPALLVRIAHRAGHCRSGDTAEKSHRNPFVCLFYEKMLITSR